MPSRVRRRRVHPALAVLLALAAVLSVQSVVSSVAAHAAGSPWANRTPGTPVAPLPEINRATSGGTNPKVGAVPSTARLGVPDAGVVPRLGDPNAHAADGAYVAYESALTSRIVDLMVVSSALGGDAPVRLILPKGWSAGSSWPTLWLLHGGNDLTDYQSWTWDTDLSSDLANAKAMVVMPGLGVDAFATNWWNYGLGGGLQYDTFVATELPQILRGGYRAGSRQAIAGVSSGGYSALALAALHPGEYSAAASYSGLPDTQLPVVAQSIEFGSVAYFQSPFAMWGDSLLNFGLWNARNPAAHVQALSGLRLFVSSGNGQPGSLDPPGAIADAIEPLTLASSQSFVSQARAAGVPVTSDFYGNGTHSWPYWQREFHRSWPMLAGALGIAA